MFNFSQPRDDKGRFASQDGMSPTTAKVLAGAAIAAAVAPAIIPLIGPPLGRLASNLGASAATFLLKEGSAAAIGGGIAAKIGTRLAGARLGAMLGPVGAVAGALAAPAIEGLLTEALTPRPEIAAGVIGAYPRLLNHLLGK